VHVLGTHGSTPTWLMNRPEEHMRIGMPEVTLATNQLSNPKY
jgi:hypothetical protein